VADVLIEADTLRERDAHPLTQEQLAAAAFVSDRYLREILASFVARGLIRTLPRGFRIRDAQRLRAEVRRPGGDSAAPGAAPRLGDVTVHDT
jgi:hypothetical protein